MFFPERNTPLLFRRKFTREDTTRAPAVAVSIRSSVLLKSGAVSRFISVNSPMSMSEQSPELSINRNITAYILMESLSGWKCEPLFLSL